MATGRARPIKLSAADRETAQALYGRKWRQLRRWIERGIDNDDPCPLLSPVRLREWWSRNSTWRCPPEIELAAVRAGGLSRSHVETFGAQRGDGRTPDRGMFTFGRSNVGDGDAVTSRAETENSESNDQPASLAGIDLESIDPEDGDRLRELKQIQGARFAELKERLRLGAESSVAESKYLKLCETVDKIESRITERLQKRGLYLLRETVERDAAAVAELLRQAGASLARRVLERCGSLTADQRVEVAAAIEATRTSQERVLARLVNYDSGDDLLRDLGSCVKQKSQSRRDIRGLSDVTPA